MFEDFGRGHRALPNAYYNGISLGEVCTCDLMFLYAYPVVWPELQVMLTPIPGVRDKETFPE
jgi:hypothetical protein